MRDTKSKKNKMPNEINNSKKVTKKLNGSCLCGLVSFKILGKLRDVIYCHCAQCLRTHGHFSAYTQVEKKLLELVNCDGLKWYNSSKKARRGFCMNCGASIFYERFGSKKMSIAAGMFESIDFLKSKEHIFFNEKPNYYEINDKLIKWSQYYLEKL